MAKKKETKEKVEEKKVNTTVELKNQIKKLKEELFQLQLDHQQRKLKNTSSLGLKRKEIASLLTTLRALELIQQ